MSSSDPGTALVTGATAGIGEAIARRLALAGFNLVLTGRRAERLEALASEIRAERGVEAVPLALDVRDHQAVRDGLAAIPSEMRPVDVLVNNAGLARGLAPIHEGDVGHWDEMIDTNLKGLLYMTREVAPTMVERGRGHIVNIGSLAGKEVYAEGNVYCATKHAVDALGRAMRIDLVPHGVKVTNVNPGLTETEFSVVRFDGDRERASRVYEGFEPLSADDVADAVEYAVTRPEHVNVNDILLTPTAQGHSKLVVKD